MALPALVAAPMIKIGLVTTVAEVSGVGDLVVAGARFLARAVMRARRADAAALDQMVDLARARVPRDTGRLYNGISGRFEGDVAVFEASAVRISGSGRESADYAGFVERGTKAGLRGRSASVADQAYFTRAEWSAAHPGSGAVPGRQYRSGPLRRVHHPHPGTTAQPFFFNSAAEVLRDHGDELQAAMAEEAGAAGWGT